MSEFIRFMKPALFVTLTMFVLCGLIYPVIVTGAAQMLFPHKANGSMVTVDGEVVGSEIIGQAFTGSQYFKGRISSINYNVYTKEDMIPNELGEIGYAGVGSGTFNYGPSNPELVKRIEADIEAFLKENPTVKREDIPADLLTASGSGLDPHISIQAAKIQIDRIVNASGLSVEEVEQIIRKTTESRLFNVFGEEKMNFVKANILIEKELR